MVFREGIMKMNSVIAALITIGIAIIYLFIGSIISGIESKGEGNPVVITFWPLLLPCLLFFNMLSVGLKIGDNIGEWFRCKYILWKHKRRKKNEYGE